MIKRTLSDGRKLEVQARTFYNCEAFINGKSFYVGPIEKFPKARKVGDKLWNHHMGAIVLTDPEASQLQKEMEALRPAPAPLEEQEYGKLMKEYDRLESLRDYPGDYFSKKAILDKKLQTWKANNPQLALKYRIESMQAKADHFKSLAVGALVYDADGWLNNEEQRRRHDDFMAQVAEIEKEIETLKKG